MNISINEIRMQISWWIKITTKVCENIFLYSLLIDRLYSIKWEHIIVQGIFQFFLNFFLKKCIFVEKFLCLNLCSEEDFKFKFNYPKRNMNTISFKNFFLQRLLSFIRLVYCDTFVLKKKNRCRKKSLNIFNNFMGKNLFKDFSF